MPGLRVMPCLDVRDGRVVKGTRFQELRDVGAVADLAAEYERQGADELVLLDIAATPAGRSHALELVREARRVLSIPLTVGGGVRSLADADALLGAGADKVAVNSAAVARPALLAELAERFGVQCVVLAVDAKRAPGIGHEVVVRSGRDGTGRGVLAWLREAAALGAGEVLLTSWDRDGTGSGYDLELLQAAAARCPLPLIASGGAAGPEDLVAAARAGADGLLAASIFHDGRFTVGDVKAALAAAELEVRS